MTFSTLPTEIIVEVLMELPDLHSIHSLCRASRRVYDIYQDPQLQLRIIRSLILRTGDIRDEANIYSLLQTLKCIIEEEMVKRDVALSILQDEWKLFAENGYEQLLIPFARVLAWSYASNKRKPEAIRLLTTIINQDEPFNSKDSLSKSSLMFLPLRMLLHRLRPKIQHPSKAQLERLQEDVPIAEIRPGSVKWDVISGESRQTALSEKGIIFKKDLIMIKCSPRRSTLIAPTIYGMRYGGHGLATGGRLITHIERQNALRGSLLNGDTGVSATNLLAHEGLITHDDMNLLLARCASAGYYLR